LEGKAEKDKKKELVIIITYFGDGIRKGDRGEKGKLEYKEKLHLYKTTNNRTKGERKERAEGILKVP